MSKTSDSDSQFARVSLRIHHPSLLPDAISTQLGRDPDHIGFKGEPRGRSPLPTVAKWGENYWTAEFVGGSIEERVAAIIRLLIDRESALRTITKTGGRVDLYMFLSPDSGLGLVLKPEQLLMLGQLDVELGLDIYFDKTLAK